MDVFSQLLSPLLSFVGTVFAWLLFACFVFLTQFAIRFFIACKCFPFSRTADYLRTLKIKNMRYDFLRWVLIDFKERFKNRGEFREYGFTFFVGRQGSGKTSALVEYLKRMKERYPKCIVVSNFKCKYSDFIMHDWLDLLNIRNGEDGIIFAIDEIHSEYSSASSKDVPENLISEISQQRKQRIKIVGTAQFYSRVAKPLREQATTVVTCSSILGRMIKSRTYDAVEYSICLDNAVAVKKKLKPIGRHKFVLSDELRSCFDTYEKINRMRRLENSNAGVNIKGRSV